MSKAKKIILITFLSIIGIAFLISAYYLATYELPAPVDKRAIVKEKALNYLKDRYGEEFEITSCGEYVNSDNYIAYAYVKRVPQNDDYKITIRGWVTKEKITFRDNYVAIKLKPAIKEYIAKTLKNEYSEYKIRIEFPTVCLENTIDVYETVEDFFERDDFFLKHMDIYIVILTENINNKEVIKEENKHICTKLVNSGIRGTTTIYYLNNNQIFNNVDETVPSELGKCGKDYVYAHCVLKKNSEFNVDIVDD